MGCAQTPKGFKSQLEPVPAPIELQDADGYKNLHTGLKAHIKALKKLAPQNKKMVFGRRSMPLHKYVKSLSYLLTFVPDKQAELEAQKLNPVGGEGSACADALQKVKVEDKFMKAVRENFEFYGIRAHAYDEPGYVKVTGYYTPLLRGARKPSARFSHALYRRPKSLVQLPLASWCEKFESLSSKLDCSLTLRGRVNKKQKFVPYYTRAEIYGASRGRRLASGALKSRAWAWAPEEGTALLWLEDLDAFFLEIQGSGRVVFQDGEEWDVGYADQNGHPYRAIGRDLLHKIPLEKMSLQSIRAYLKTLKPRARQKILNKNKSVVFFRVLSEGPQTAMGTRAVAGRSVATDSQFFPRGGVGFLIYQNPVKLKTEGRFVLAQDRGGAIRGPHKVDLYWGVGEEAEALAGPMQHGGQLLYLVPKAEFIKGL